MPISSFISKFLLSRQFLEFNRIFTQSLHGFLGQAFRSNLGSNSTLWPFFPLLEFINQFSFNAVLCLFALSNVCSSVLHNVHFVSCPYFLIFLFYFFILPKFLHSYILQFYNSVAGFFKLTLREHT